MTDLELQISQSLIRLRKKRNRNIQQIADEAGLDRSHYARIEKGKGITLKTLKKILDVHELTFKQFSEQELK